MITKEIVSIETAGKLAKLTKLQKGIKELKEFIKSEMQKSKTIGGGAFDCCVEELEKVLSILDFMDDIEKTDIPKKYNFNKEEK